MASIHKDIPIDAHPDHVWDAVRDFGAVHTRLAPGFVTDARRGGGWSCDRERAGEPLQRLGAGHRRWRYALPADLDRRCAAERNRTLSRRPDGSGRAGRPESVGAQGGMTAAPFLDALGRAAFRADPLARNDGYDNAGRIARI